MSWIWKWARAQLFYYKILCVKNLLCLSDLSLTKVRLYQDWAYNYYAIVDMRLRLGKGSLSGIICCSSADWDVRQATILNVIWAVVSWDEADVDTSTSSKDGWHRRAPELLKSLAHWCLDNNSFTKMNVSHTFYSYEKKFIKIHSYFSKKAILRTYSAIQY